MHGGRRAKRQAGGGAHESCGTRQAFRSSKKKTLSPPERASRPASRRSGVQCGSRCIPRCMAEVEAPPPRRPGRRRLPTPERSQRQREAKRQWAQRNKEYLRVVSQVRHLDPEYRARRRATRLEKQRARLEAGGDPPKPVGRPCIYTREEARARRLACMRRCAARARERGCSFKRSPTDDKNLGPEKTT